MPPSTSSLLYLDTDCRAFSGALSALNGRSTLEFSCQELIWAAITVGYPNLDHLIGTPNEQKWADTFRVAIIYAFLSSDAEGRIVRSDTFQRLDRSEKGAVSYYLGLFLAKLAADRLLDIQLLWHFDSYSQAWGVPGPLRLRPDLVACSWRDEWFVIEAKGRSHGFSARDMNRAKDQVQSVSQLRTENGPRTPQATIASFAFFDNEGNWEVRWVDPEVEPITIELSVQDLVSRYYRPLKMLMGEEVQQLVVSIEGNEFLAMLLNDVDVWVGAPRDILERQPETIGDLRDGLPEIVGQPATEEDQTVTDGRGRLWHLARDGIIVRAGERWPN